MPSTASPAGGLTWIDLLVIAGYLLTMLLMGLWIARRQHSTDDFFVGGRNLPSWAVGISILASIMSTISYLGTPGEMFRTGLSFLTRQLGVPLVLLVVWFVWIPFFMRLKLTSAYEYLEHRFSYATRALAAVFCMLLLFGWMAVVVLTASRAMVSITALDIGSQFSGDSFLAEDAEMYAIILSVGLFSVLYTTLGGLRAVVWTDVIQFMVLIAGALFTIGYISWSTHSGLGDWMQAARDYPHRESVEWYSFDIGNRSTVLFIATGMAFWFACTHGANQVTLQRYFSVKNIWAARRSYLISALASLIIGVLLACVGLALMYFMQTHELPASQDVFATDRGVRNIAQDSVFPEFIRLYLPSGLRGMVVAALFAAAMSTIDSGANSVSTIVTVDFFRPFAAHRRSDAAELRLARILTGTMGLVIVALTVLLYHISKGTDIITLCQKGFNCFLGPLGGLFVLGMFSRTATSRTVIPAVLLGEVVGISTSYSEELFDFRFSTHLVVLTSWLATVVTSLLLSLISGAQATDEQQSWMWVPVVHDEHRSELEQPESDHVLLDD